MIFYLDSAWIFLLLTSSVNVFCASIPKLERNIFNVVQSNSTTGTGGFTQSNATSTGVGAVAGVAGIVTGNTSPQLQSQTGNGTASSTMAFQTNCSDYSSAYAEGGTSADATAFGDCLTNSDHNVDQNSTVSSRAVPEMVKM